MKKIIILLLTCIFLFTSSFNTYAYELINDDPIITQAQAIACLRKYNASEKLINAVPFIYEYAKEVGIDPGVVMAMTTIETGWGKSRLFRYNNNPGGIKAKGGWAKYSSVEEGYKAMINLIATYAGLMNKHSYLYGYSKTTEGLAGMYWTNYGNDYGYHNQLTRMVKMMQSFPRGEETVVEDKPKETASEIKKYNKKNIDKNNNKKENKKSASSILYDILNGKKNNSNALDIIYDILNK